MARTKSASTRRSAQRTSFVPVSSIGPAYGGPAGSLVRQLHDRSTAGIYALAFLTSMLEQMDAAGVKVPLYGTLPALIACARATVVAANEVKP